MPSSQTNLEKKSLDHFMALKYPIEIVEDDEGRFVASIPDLPGCWSYGDSVEDALAGLRETKGLWLEGRLKSGLPVPEPIDIDEFSGKFVLRIPKALHRSLDREAKKEGVSLNHYVSHILSERHRNHLADVVVASSLASNYINASLTYHGQHAWSEWKTPVCLVQTSHRVKEEDYADVLFAISEGQMAPKSYHAKLKPQTAHGVFDISGFEWPLKKERLAK